jgi:hypothetical protein
MSPVQSSRTASSEPLDYHHPRYASLTTLVRDQVGAFDQLSMGDSHRHEPGNRGCTGEAVVVHMRPRCSRKCNAFAFLDSFRANVKTNIAKEV